MKKASPKQKSMTFLPMNRTCSFTGRPSVLELAIANEIPLNHSCGGMGSCTTCLVHIKKGAPLLPVPEDVEKEHAQSRAFAPHERLSCQIEAIDGLVVWIPPSEPIEDFQK